MGFIGVYAVLDSYRSLASLGMTNDAIVSS